MADARILLAEDDVRVREAVSRALRLDGYEVEAVDDGLAVLERVALGDDPDLVILDIGLPQLDGLETCRRLRDRSALPPILMLTARHSVGDRVAGLDAGADDYLVKPFALSELAARVRALLRRTSVTGTNGTITVRDLRLDLDGRRAWRAGREVDLTRTEFQLLELLVYNAGIVLSRETLYDRIWGFDFETGSRTLDVHISYLRTKTEAGGETRCVETVRGVGFVIRRDRSE